ncbi:MAG: DUF72 domain-containing protein [Gemmatimonadota bacterium]|nr:MAG: DUF72 domain-containing protein [Gemmatimonadota bacterium]
MSARTWVGTSGWHYRDWRGRFYPEDLASGAWLDFYSRQFSTAEINNSFYQLPKPETWAKWRETVPSDFLFSVKAHRLITHQKKLKDGSGYLENFLEHASLLGDRLGPVLFQLPGTWHANPARLAGFVERLPQTGARYVFEFRHESWLAGGILDVLRSRNIAFCCFDMPGLSWPVLATADFAYMRFHGAGQVKYAGRYHKNTLKRWARVLRELTQTVDELFVYFNNDFQAHAVDNACTLKELLAVARR